MKVPKGKNPMSSRTRTDLVKAVVKLGLTESRAQKAVDVFFETLLRSLQSGEKVSLSGFGVWEWRERPSRMARNPKTGAKVHLPARKRLVFRASPQLKKRVNLKPNT